MSANKKLELTWIGKENEWISIDDDECHYLKVLGDEIFGRSNFVTCCIWQKIHSIKNDAKYISVNHYIYNSC